MFSGVNPRQLKQVMKQMGISQEELNASQVIIKTPEKTLVFDSPEVQRVVMQGQETFQIVGSYSESESPVNVSISDEDIQIVSEQAGVSKNEAMKALDNSKGDIAQAILDLSK